MSNPFGEYCVYGRGGKRGDTFHNIYPEIESEVRMFLVINSQRNLQALQLLVLQILLKRNIMRALVFLKLCLILLDQSEVVD